MEMRVEAPLGLAVGGIVESDGFGEDEGLPVKNGEVTGLVDSLGVGKEDVDSPGLGGGFGD